MLSKGVRYMPEPSGYIDEIVRAIELSADPPYEHIQVFGHTIQVCNGEHVCHLTRVDGVWQGDCHYGRTHDPETQPCCDVQALERWVQGGQLAGLGLDALLGDSVVVSPIAERCSVCAA